MKIKLIAIGKTDNKELLRMLESYQKRLSLYFKFEFKIIPDIKKVKNLSEDQQKEKEGILIFKELVPTCLLYTSPSPRDKRQSRMPSSA